MKKLTMKELIIHVLANWRADTILISILLDIARHIMDNVSIEIIGFSATTSHIFQTVWDNPRMFKLGQKGRSIELYSPHFLATYVNHNKIDEELTRIICKYIDEVSEPLKYTFVDLNFAKEYEDYLKASPIHIDWLVNMVEKHTGISSNSYHLACNAQDLENFTIIAHFYRVVSEYCETNLIPCVNNASKSYVVSWGEPENMKYVEICKITEGASTYYRAILSRPTNYSVYYGNIAFGVPDEQFDSKQKELDNIKQLLFEAKSHGIPYKNLKGVIDDLYDICPDLHES